MKRSEAIARILVWAKKHKIHEIGLDEASSLLQEIEEMGMLPPAYWIDSTATEYPGSNSYYVDGLPKWKEEEK